MASTVYETEICVAGREIPKPLGLKCAILFATMLFWKVEIRRLEWFRYSGAPAAQRAAKRSPIIIENGTTRMHRNRNPCNSFLMVKMASGMDHGCVRPTTATTTTTNDVAQHGGHPANFKSCSLGLQHISLILDMHIMCN